MRLLWILIAMLAAGAAMGLYTRMESSAPKIGTRTTPVDVGAEHTHEFRLMDEGMGLERVRVWLESSGSKIDLFAESYDGNKLMGASLPIQRHVEVTIRPEELGLEDGPATLRAEVVDFSWLANRSEVEVPLLIDTKPPRVALRTGLTYVRRGGAELVVYEVQDEVAKHGVRMGEHFSPGFPHPADPDLFVALYPLPPATEPGQAPAVIAVDRAGNQAQVGVAISIIERSFPEDRIRISDSFLQQKVPELLGNGHENLLAGYLKINGEMRLENGRKILEICEQSSEERLWNGPFLQLPNSNVGAGFAEQRTYEYKGQTVDRQVHMGYDLASTSRTEVPAANDGVVVYADDLGIYGQTVIIDHGLSLFSFYGHLSEIAVEKGQAVARGESIGRTGTTGLAGGDHLHYGMMVAGVFVDPLEWFDPRWIQEHIEAKLTPAEPEPSL